MVLRTSLPETHRVVRQLLRWIAALTLVVSLPNLSFAQTTRVSVSSAGVEGDAQSFESSVSADGRYVAFGSVASNLTVDDTNNQWDVFVHDRQTGATTRVSVASDGTQGNGESRGPSISADGRYVAFWSDASNLVAGDTNGTWDVFVHDRTTGATTQVSVAGDGTKGNSYSFDPSISADGRYVAFSSFASNLVAGDTNGVTDVFVHDRTTGATTRVDVAGDGTQGNNPSDGPSISADGRYVAFASEASNLVVGDTNSVWDAFVHDRTTGATTRVSVASDGTQGNAASYARSISADGRYVTFDSNASNLVAGDTNSVQDVFVHDRSTGTTTRVNVSSGGAQGNARSQAGLISADGRYVAFDSDASNLVDGDTNNQQDVFVHDRVTGTTKRVSVASDGTPSAGFFNHSYTSSITADGRIVTFYSTASNLVPNDTNDVSDVFVVQHAVASPPGSFQKTSPTNGATGQPTSLTLQWGASSGATSYEYCLDGTPNATCDSIWVSTGATTSAAVTNLTPGATYSWHVRALNDDGTTYASDDMGAFQTFTVTSSVPPGAFAKIAPTNGGGTGVNPVLTWGASSGATSYEYCVDITLNATCDGSWISAGSATSASLLGLTADVAYSWQVRAVNTNGTVEANGGTWWTFVPAEGSVSADFNGDGKQDLLFQNPDGQVYAWFLNGLSFASGAWLAQDVVGPDWRVVGTSDLSGDQKPDLLWQNQSTGAVAMHTYDGTTRTDGHTIPIAANTPWRIMATGDFNNDGRADIVWQNATSGEVYIWFMKVTDGWRAEFDSGAYVTHPDLSPVTLNPVARTEWRIAGAGDFDNDGKTDLVWRNLVSGALVAWTLDGTVFTGSLNYGAVNLNWQLRAVGDYYGDSAPDLVWQNSVTGEIYLWVRDGGALLPNTSVGAVNLIWQIVGAK